MDTPATDLPKESVPSVSPFSVEMPPVPPQPVPGENEQGAPQGITMETVVIPAATPSSSQDPFVPQAVSVGADPPPAPPPVSQGSALPKRLLMIAVFLFLAVGLFLAHDLYWVSLQRPKRSRLPIGVCGKMMQLFGPS